MEITGFMGGLYKLTEWIYRLALLNVLWIAGTVIGLGIFGFYPATVAMFSVVRKWAMHELDVSVFTTFQQSYKQEFLKSNALGLIITGLSLVFYIDYHFLIASKSSTVQLLLIPLWIVIFIFVGMMAYAFPVYVHFQMSIKEVIRSSFILLFMNPISTLMMLGGSFGLVFLLQFAPPLAIVCSGNVLALTLMKPAYNAFNKLNPVE